MNLNEFGQGDYGIEDEFEDLEVYFSDDDGDEPEENSRLTKKAGDKEMNEVLDQYNEFLNDELPEVKDENKLSAITEQSIESSGMTAGERPINSLEQKKLRMKEMCVTTLGDKKFKEIHKYLLHHRKKGTDESKVSPSTAFFKLTSIRSNVI